MKTLQIQCRLNNAVITYDSFYMLDALLAWAWVQQQLDGEAFDEQQAKIITEYDLPLIKIAGIWAATALLPINKDEDVKYYHKRTTHGHFTKAKGGFKPNTSAGRWQERRIPLPANLADVWVGYAKGDAAQIKELLEYVTNLGKRRNTGTGEVAEWRIEECEQHDIFIINGQLSRPMPVVIAERLGYRFDAEPVFQGVKPPYWLPESKCEAYSIGDRLI